MMHFAEETPRSEMRDENRASAGLIEASLNKVIVESRIFVSSSVIQWWEPTTM